MIPEVSVTVELAAGEQRMVERVVNLINRHEVPVDMDGRERIAARHIREAKDHLSLALIQREIVGRLRAQQTDPIADQGTERT